MIKEKEKAPKFPKFTKLDAMALNFSFLILVISLLFVFFFKIKIVMILSTILIGISFIFGMTILLSFVYRYFKQ